ncbi:MAG TPA: type II toxin-antitoxin system HipA family toxin [Chloroflexota bacterium]
MIKVWTDSEESGFLDRLGDRGTTFSYGGSEPDARAVSLTMPVRVQSYDSTAGLPPIFDMNLPEGALRERLRLRFAKATGRFDDYELLTVVGRSQLGRIRYTGTEDWLDEDVPFQSVDEILAGRRGGDLYRFLLDQFATVSGVSGVQPKVLVRDPESLSMPEAAKHRLSARYRGATHIVKFWDAHEFPQLAANEYFCLKAAERCGLNVPAYRLAEDGGALVVDRFDLRDDGTYRGFEDMGVLNARLTADKYRGSYESSVMRRFQQFSNSPHVSDDLDRLFTLIVLNCAVRNGDAHLKNFGVLYEDVQGEARLAPVYDVVTTTAYLPQDQMALTLNGTTHWPEARELQRLGETRMGAAPARVKAVFERVSDAMSDVAGEIRVYTAEHAEFASIAERMLYEWDAGRRSIQPAG